MYTTTNQDYKFHSTVQKVAESLNWGNSFFCKFKVIFVLIITLHKVVILVSVYMRVNPCSWILLYTILKEEEEEKRKEGRKKYNEVIFIRLLYLIWLLMRLCTVVCVYMWAERFVDYIFQTVEPPLLVISWAIIYLFV